MGILGQKSINEQVNRINLLSNYKLGVTINENNIILESDSDIPEDIESKDESEIEKNL